MHMHHNTAYVQHSLTFGGESAILVVREKVRPSLYPPFILCIHETNFILQRDFSFDTETR